MSEKLHTPERRMVESVRITSVKVNGRHRKDIGDLSGLCDSIERIGLLHPIVLGPGKVLIAGERRLEAFKRLGRKEIPASVAENLADLGKRLEAEQDENTCRKDLTLSEGVSIGRAIEDAYKPKAEAAKAEAPNGKRTGRPKAGEKSVRKTFPKTNQDESARTTAVAAAASGRSRPTYEKAKAVVAAAEKEPEKYAPLVAEMDRTGKANGVFKKLKTLQAAEEIAAEAPPLPKGPFRVIVADPPWQYDNRADDPTHRAANPYPSMSLAEIKAMEVESMACKDAVLWLWTTNAFLRDAFEIAEAWGFTYKTLLTWTKDRMGTGDWLRGKTEHCLMCVRGKPTITLTNQTTAISGPLRKHSQKPEEFYKLVESLCPGSKAELFSRQPREGWIGHGNESAATAT